jgi:hypothetical protein
MIELCPLLTYNRITIGPINGKARYLCGKNYVWGHIHSLIVPGVGDDRVIS